jgi:hypothetical protein
MKLTGWLQFFPASIKPLLTFYFPVIQFKQIFALDTEYYGAFWRRNRFTDVSHVRFVVTVKNNATNSNEELPKYLIKSIYLNILNLKLFSKYNIWC